MNTSTEAVQPSLARRMLKTGLPIFAELFLISLFHMADTALLKWCGTVTIAAVGLTAEPIFVLNFIFYGLQTALTILLSGFYANGENDTAKRYLTSYLKCSTVAAVLMSGIVIVFAAPVLRIFGADAVTLPIAVSYFRIALIGFVFRLTYGAITAILKCVDAPQWSFLLNLLSNAVNITFDILLIYGIGPFPRLGAAGAALATALACLVGLICAVVILKRKFISLGDPIRLADWKHPWLPEMKHILTVAVPLIFEKLLIRIGSFLTIQRIALLGATAFATHRILSSLTSIPFMGFNAASTTVMILYSGAFATGRRDEARQIAKLGTIASLLYAIPCSLACVFCGELCIRIYSNDPLVIAQALPALRVIAVYQLFQSVALVLASVVKSCGLARISSTVTGLGIAVIRPALVYLLAPSLGILGVWIAIGTDEIFRFVVLITQKRRIARAFENAPQAAVATP